MPKWFLLSLILLAPGCWFGDDTETLRLSGKTMGTTYNITATGPGLEEAALLAEVEAALAAVNGKMSNWDPASEVSTFSASEITEPVTVSAEFATVIAAADEVHEKSGGKFDVTLGPLIELWGFGPRKPEDPLPSEQSIASALAEVGQGRLLTLDKETGTLAKAAPGVGINLSAIAKGYGIDAVAATLEDAGVTDYMVEIGGDLYAKGENPEGNPWQIGIEKPEAGAKSVQLVVPVSNRGLATSGDYRNYFEHEGTRYSHILDPVSGRPVTHSTTSVTVVAEDAMMADAWATALLAAGSTDGMRLAETHGIAAFFIDRDVDAGADAYITSQSGAFTALMPQN